jgi:hypothetical protein
MTANSQVFHDLNSRTWPSARKVRNRAEERFLSTSYGEAATGSADAVMKTPMDTSGSTTDRKGRDAETVGRARRSNKMAMLSPREKRSLMSWSSSPAAESGSLKQRAAILHCEELSQTVEGQESLLLPRRAGRHRAWLRPCSARSSVCASAPHQLRVVCSTRRSGRTTRSIGSPGPSPSVTFWKFESGGARRPGGTDGITDSAMRRSAGFPWEWA